MTNRTDSTNPSAFDIASGMENDAHAVSEFAQALVLMSEGNHGSEWQAVSRVAHAIVCHADNLIQAQQRLFKVLNPATKAAA